MTEAIFGLVGVVLGGLLTGGVDWLMTRRGERQTTRALARAIYAELVEMKSKCAYCSAEGDWTLVDEPFELPTAWKEHELALARLLTWDQWVGLQAVRSTQFALRQLASVATHNPSLRGSHLPVVTSAAIEAIDQSLPAIERLSREA